MFLHLFQSKISIDLYFKKHYFKFLIETGHLPILAPRRVRYHQITLTSMPLTYLSIPMPYAKIKMSVKTFITNTETNGFDTNTSNVKKLTITTISDVAPFNFSDEKGAITGFDSDVLHCQKQKA